MLITLYRGAQLVFQLKRDQDFFRNCLIKQYMILLVEDGYILKCGTVRVLFIWVQIISLKALHSGLDKKG